MKHYMVRRYTFQELEGAAREKAIQEYQSFTWESLENDEIKEYLIDKLCDHLGHYPCDGRSGSHDLKLEFSLSYCQGDGVAIYGRLTREEGSLLTWPEKCAYVELTRNQFGRYYSHWNTFNVEGYDDEGEPIDIDSAPIEKQLRDICRDLERQGYRLIESLTSREAAIANLEVDQEADFLADGRIDKPRGIVEEVSA